MLSYTSLLVFVLATSAVSPVRAVDPSEIESTSPSEPTGRPRFKITPGKVLAGIGTLVVVGIIVGNLVGGPSPHFKNNNTTNTTQPTSTTQPPAPQPAAPPRAFTGREERIVNCRGLSVDTSIGYSEARSISDDDNQIMHTSSFDLLNGDHLEDALGLRLFSRIPDELD